MDIFQRIKNKFRLGSIQDMDPRDRRRILLVYSFFGMVFYLGYAVYAYLVDDFLLAGVNIAAALLTLGILLFLVKRNESQRSSLLLILVFGIDLLFLFSSGGIREMGYVFAFLFPSVSLLLLGIRQGTMANLILLGLMLGIAFLPEDFAFSPGYPPDVLIRICLVYVMLYFFTIVYGYFSQDIIYKLRRSIDETSTAKKAKDDFISGLSHQIRTPLNNIVVLGNILSEAKLDEKQSDLVETLVASANNLVNIVDNIAKVSSIEKTEGKKEDFVFNIRSSVENTIDFLTQKGIGRNRFLVSSQEGVEPVLKGNPVRLKQIILNLLEGIVKNDPTGEVSTRISLSQDRISESQAKISFEVVADRVIRIYTETGQKAADDHARLQDDFQLASDLIVESGDQLRIESAPQEVIFTFSLHFEKVRKTGDEAEKDTTLYRIRKTLIPEKLELNQSNVLLVEDNLINQKIVVLSLKKFVKNIDVANHGKEALDKFGTSKYDLILMDIQMPVMDGLVATRKIRELESSTNSHIPIIAITANALLGDKETCLAAGMDDYIAKPFQIDDLVQKMSRLLSAGNRQTFP